MNPPDLDSTIPVPLAQLVDLAIDAWRLDRWLARNETASSAAPARYANRRFAEFLKRYELETLDLTGQAYEPGLAIEIVGTVNDRSLPPETVLIDEMISPMCLWSGQVVRYGQAVTRSSRAPE